VRTTGAPAAMASLARNEARAIDPDLPLDHVRSLDEAISDARWNTRIATTMILVIAGIALLLSMVGLYALTAHAVTQRAPEIGVRMALGAPLRAIRWLILRRALLQLAAGLIAGLACTVAWERLLESGARPATGTRLTDPLTLLPVALLIALVAVVSCLWPARRATRCDPVSVLRAQ
jgi:ABC-type antimicrobial peptide transport system permease subunit